MVDQRLKDLRGASRRDFLRWGATVAACMGLERSRLLNVLNDTAGSAAADTAACNSTNRLIAILDGGGGLANWTLPWTLPAVLKGNNPNYSHYAIGKGVDAMGYDKPFVYGPDSPWQTDSKWKMTAFVAGRNQTHTDTPTSVLSTGQAGFLAAAGAIQQANPTLLPVLSVNDIPFGNAPGQPAVAQVNSPAALVNLFNSAASRTLMQAQANGPLAEAYYKAFLGLNASAGRSTVAKQYGVGKVSMNLLAKNLAAQLTPTAADLAMFGIAGNTPATVQSLSRSMITSLKAFSLGLSSMMMSRGFFNDPHGMFAGGDGQAMQVGQSIGKMMNGLYNMAKTMQDPGCTSKTLADTLVFTVFGDTYKTAFDRDGWNDGTTANTNIFYVMGNGYLKTGWIGEITPGGAQGWDPTTGANNGAYGGRGDALGASATAAALFAVAKADMKRVRDFYNGPAIDGVVNLNVTG